jgi:hypothetical protein
MGLAACGEIPQDAPKPFVEANETRPYAGATFNGERARYEKALAERTDTQDDYRRIKE